MIFYRRKIFVFFSGFFLCLAVTIIIIAGLYLFSQKERNKFLENSISSNEKELSLQIIKFKDAHQLEFQNLRNNTFKKLDSDSIIYVVNFWATWCKPCIKEMPTIEKFIEENNSRKISWIVASNEDVDVIKKFQENRHLRVPIFHYNANQFSKLNFEINSLPTTLIIPQKKDFVYVIKGAHNWNSELMKSFLLKI